MRLEEAIRIETIHNEHNPDITDPERWEAHRLLVEAGEAIQEWRIDYNDDALIHLPGETKGGQNDTTRSY